jgi:hypothetical protein
MAQQAADELALTVVWAALALLTAVLMLGFATASPPLAAPVRDVGLTACRVLVVASVVGLGIHCIRFMIAEFSSRLGERRFRLRRGMASALAARVSGPVQEERQPIPRLLTAATDLDIVIQIVVGLIVVLR